MACNLVWYRNIPNYTNKQPSLVHFTQVVIMWNYIFVTMESSSLNLKNFNLANEITHIVD